MDKLSRPILYVDRKPLIVSWFLKPPRLQKELTPSLFSLLFFIVLWHTQQHSQQILRDNAHLSLHLRNYQTHLANRLLLFQMRPNERKSWHSLALAYYLLGDLDSFEKVLGGLLEGVQRVPSEGRVEESEVREWRVRGLVESGKWADALEALDKGVREEEIVNREEAGVLRGEPPLSLTTLSGRVRRRRSALTHEFVLLVPAEILRNLGKKDEAEDAYRALLERNQDNRQFYIDFLLNRGLDICAFPSCTED